MEGEIQARGLLREVGVGEDLVVGLGLGDDLLVAGVGSAAMIELGLLIEEVLDRALSAEEVEAVSTLGDVVALLGTRTPPAGGAF